MIYYLILDHLGRGVIGGNGLKRKEKNQFLVRLYYILPMNTLFLSFSLFVSRFVLSIESEYDSSCCISCICLQVHLLALAKPDQLQSPV